MKLASRMPRVLRFSKTLRGKIGLWVLGFVVAVAVLGPFVARTSPSAIVGPPGAGPSSAYPLGTDYLGHDVLSRVLWGGPSMLIVALAATALAYLFGLVIGVVAGYNRSLVDPILMRSVDVILAFPPLLFIIIVATAVGTGESMVVMAVAVVLAPGVARIIYSATRETSVRGYVEAAVARGERTTSILRREILPGIMGPVIANVGLSLTYAVLLIAALNFLNLGEQPPSANWALMVSENRSILTINPWATIAPAAMIAALTIGFNLVGDAIFHGLGHSDLEEMPVEIRTLEEFGSSAGPVA